MVKFGARLKNLVEEILSPLLWPAVGRAFVLSGAALQITKREVEGQRISTENLFLAT